MAADTSRRTPIRFGINFLPNHAFELAEWTKVAEEAGFDIVGIADSQSLYRDVYVCTALAAVSTHQIRLGPRVINPRTRHPAVAACAAATIAELAPGRTMLGVGTGDSAVDNIGVRPATHAELADYIRVVRELLKSGRANYKGAECTMTWGQVDVPIYIAASGPKTLQLAGEIADGVVINTGLLPAIIKDSIAQVQVGCDRAGRKLADIDMWWLPITNVSESRERAIHEIAPTLASAGSHLSRFTTEGKHIPPDLLEGIKALGRRYRSDQHDKPNSTNRALISELGLQDYLVQRFAIAGQAEDCIRKLEQAIEAGASQFWMSVHFDDKARFMRDWAAKVMSAFRTD